MRPGVWPSIGVLLEVAGGILGLGLLQEAETLETGTPPTREGILILNPSYVVTGTSNDHVADKHNTFKYNESSTYRPTQETFNIICGSGIIKGLLAYDTIRIGDLVITDQPFGLSLEEYGFESAPFDDILGLNYPCMSAIGAIPIFDNLKKQGVISEPVFAFYLSKCRGKDSVVMFGGVDKAYYMGELKWVPLTQADTRNAFKYYESSTSRDMNTPLSIICGTGIMKGFLAYDTIQTGDLVSTDQPFGLSLELNKFDNTPFDGLLGLNYPRMSAIGAIPIFDNLKKQGAISEPVFAFYLSKCRVNGCVVMFGGVDKDYYQGGLNWVPLDKIAGRHINMDQQASPSEGCLK
ncbi:hypothetical protein AB1E18_019186 [Capra hircus]